MGLSGKKGVLLVNLGTPDEPTRGAVYRYLKEFLLDWRVIDINPISRNLLVRGIIAPFRSGSSAKGYQELWTAEGSPLKVNGVLLTELVREKLGADYEVELAMRYQSPSIESSIKALMAKKVSEIIVFPLFPHYASASTGSVHEEVMRILSKQQVIPEIRLINSFYDHPLFIEAFAQRGLEHNLEEYDHILFSYHGIPERQMIKADSGDHCVKTKDCCKSIGLHNQFCYSAQCYATTAALVKRLGLKEGQYSVSFQSRLGKTPWIQPYTTDMLKTRYDAGDRSILVFCPAFVSDCLETTVEISSEYNELFQEMGGKGLQLVESLNTHPTWVEAVCDMIKER